jgi:triacylglycerol esterase/lipase EstA (alpha/beta hydrolase family)
MYDKWRIGLMRAVGSTSVCILCACAMVNVERLGSHQSVIERRVDIIGVGRLSDRTRQALNVVAQTPDDCQRDFTSCTSAVTHSPGLSDEQRLGALSELWLGRAIEVEHAHKAPIMDEATLEAYLEAARFAYAYLFFTARSPADRAFDQRQLQVMDFYNYANESTIKRLFVTQALRRSAWSQATIAGWTIARPASDVRLEDEEGIPAEIIPAANLRFKGLRDIYTRDGFGSDFVVVTPPRTLADGIAWRDPEYSSMTGALLFEGSTLEEIIDTRQVRLLTKDPYREDTISIEGHAVPLSANFTAAYGVWIARSGFAAQSIRSLLGREGGITTPRVLLMQPYDPTRLIVVMLHGLASSPEAWINVSNEVMGDDDLRRSYQVWNVYYPTNMPVAVNLAHIRNALDATLQHFDPTGTARASHDMVLVGHSMGGLISRLLISASGESLWKSIPVRSNLSPAELARLHERLGSYLQFTPMPQVTRVIFLASPHRGTPLAQHRIARWMSNLIRTPAVLLAELTSVSDVLQSQGKSDSIVARVPNSIDNLSDKDPFILAASDLPIAPRDRYNTIVGVYKPVGPLLTTNDGVVPYKSAHLDGAESELAIPSWHSVQQTPAAILEIRRILREHAADLRQPDAKPVT